MSEPIYIDKDLQEKPALDFKTLLAEAIAVVQQMSGDNWTDYNIHDPGVTILEQLCYAITELGYRANFNFEDLLASQAGTDKDFFTSQSYHTAANILPTDPIHINDFRKILIDKIMGLRNVWISPLKVSKAQSQVRGVYLAFVEASPDVFKKDSPDYEKEIKEFKKVVWKHITQYSNLGEAFEKVIILETKDVFVKAEIELTYDANVDEVHARVMFNLRKSMTRAMEFQKLETLLKEGKNVNEIFEGPQMSIGFVDDKDLVKKINILDSNTFITPIRQVDGVSYIRSLSFVAGEKDESPPRHIQYINMNEIPALGNKMDEKYVTFIRYIQHKSDVSPNIRNANKILEQLEASDKIEHNYDKSSYNDFPIPEGEVRDIEYYYSFQNHFPVIYGLGKMGLPTLMHGKKKASVMQLKGYLMLFDQIMANYFAQLANFSKLFSVKNTVTTSYFAGTISDLKDIKKMVVDVDANTIQENEFQQKLQKTVQKALETIDNFDDRRNRFIDHLLARFGEKVANYPVSRFNKYFTEEQNRKKWLDIKTDFLANIPELSRSRAQSFNYGVEYWNKDNISSMERKIKILLGITNKTLSLTKHHPELWRYQFRQDPFNFANILSKVNAEKIAPVTTSMSEVSMPITQIQVEDTVLKRIEIDKEMLTGIFELENLAIIASEFHKTPQYLLLYRKDISKSKIQHSHHYNLLKRMVALFHDAGNSEKQYWLPGEQENYIIEFLQNPKTKIYDVLADTAWKEIATFHTFEEAENAGKMLYTHIRTLNMESEGFYMVDHILLRPRNEVDKYGVHFYDEEKGVALNSVQQFEFKDFQDSAIKLASKLAVATAQARITKSGKFVTSMMEGDNELGYSKKRFKTERDAISYGDKTLKKYFGEFTKFDFYDKEAVQIYKCYDKGHEMNGDNYSFKITVVLPAWTVRFGDTQFQQALENTFRMECPAHIGIDFKWLSFPKLLEFENIYTPWLDALKNENEEIPALNHLSDQILSFIKSEDSGENDSMMAYFTRKDR